MNGRSDPWSQLARAIRARHPQAELEGEELRVVLATGTEPRVRVAVRVRPAAPGGDPAFELRVELAARARIDPAVAVAHRLTIGVLAVEGGRVVLCARLLADGLTAAALDLTLRAVVVQAAELEQRLASPRRDPPWYKDYP